MSKDLEFDDGMLDKLKDVGGNKLLVKMIDLFLAVTPDKVSGINADILAGNAADAGRIAHSLKSSAGQLGANQMSNLCSDLEQFGWEGELEKMAPLASELTLEANRVLAHFIEKRAKITEPE